MRSEPRDKKAGREVKYRWKTLITISISTFLEKSCPASTDVLLSCCVCSGGGAMLPWLWLAGLG